MILSFISLIVLTQTPATPNPDFGDAWKKTSQAIERSYYARESRKREMEDRLAHYAPLATGANSKEQFRDVVDQMIQEFKDSHFDMLTDQDQGFYLMDGLMRKDAASMPELGAWFKRNPNDTYAVQMVLNGTSAEKADLRKGDLVKSINGQPFSPVTALKGLEGKTATLEIQRGGESSKKQVQVETKPAMQMFLDASRDSSRVIEDGKRKIGYFHLWTQANEDFKNALSSAVYGKLRDTDAFILDLRDGFGGRPEGYGDPFFRPGVQLDWKYARGDMKQLFGYSKPLVVLINNGSRSAKEVLSYIFKVSHRATLIGSNTAGNVLGTSPMKITSWAFLELPMVEVYADGVRLEGRGVSPDIALPAESDVSGKDLYIKAALDYLAHAKTSGSR